MPEGFVQVLITKQALDLKTVEITLNEAFDKFVAKLKRIYQKSTNRLGFVNNETDACLETITNDLENYKKKFSHQFSFNNIVSYMPRVINELAFIMQKILLIAAPPTIFFLFLYKQLSFKLRAIIFIPLFFAIVAKIINYYLSQYLASLASEVNELYLEIGANIKFFVEFKQEAKNSLEVNLEHFIADTVLKEELLNEEPLLEETKQLPINQVIKLENAQMPCTPAITPEAAIFVDPKRVRDPSTKVQHKPNMHKNVKVNEIKSKKAFEKPYFLKEKNGITKKIYVNPFINAKNCVLYQGKSALEKVNPLDRDQFKAIIRFPKKIPSDSIGINGFKPGRFKFYSNSGKIIETEGFSGKVTKAKDHDRLKVVKKGQIKIHYPDDSVKTQSLYKCVGTM